MKLFPDTGSCQSRSRRQQVTPEPHPISWGGKFMFAYLYHNGKSVGVGES
tara:strand:+ start:2968 stop:3117 length:150 start_codon:yes stop_codon:yes gene_type:complete